MELRARGAGPPTAGLPTAGLPTARLPGLGLRAVRHRTRGNEERLAGTARRQLLPAQRFRPPPRRCCRRGQIKREMTATHPVTMQMAEIQPAGAQVIPTIRPVTAMSLRVAPHVVDAAAEAADVGA